MQREPVFRSVSQYSLRRKVVDYVVEKTGRMSASTAQQRTAGTGISVCARVPRHPCVPSPSGHRHGVFVEPCSGTFPCGGGPDHGPRQPPHRAHALLQKSAGRSWPQPAGLQHREHLISPVPFQMVGSLSQDVRKWIATEYEPYTVQEHTSLATCWTASGRRR